MEREQAQAVWLIIGQHGLEVLNDATVFRGLFYDYFPEARNRGTELLMQSVRLGLARELVQSPGKQVEHHEWQEMLGLLQASLRPRFLCALGLWTLAAWSAYLALYALGLCFMAGLPWSWPMVLTVFAVATLGFAVPGAPGGMGVYEASMVLALGWFGVDRDRAFAVALAMHLLQYLPVTALGLWRVAASGMTLRELRAGAAAE